MAEPSFPPGAVRDPVAMREAVGYDGIECTHESSLEEVLTLKHDRYFLLVDRHGDIAPPGRCGLGLFHDDTRILSHYRLRFEGDEPVPLSAQVVAPFMALVDLAFTDHTLGGDPWDPKNVIHIRRELLLDDRLVERVTLTSYLNWPIDFTVALDVGGDFADIFEVRGWRRERRGQYFRPVATDRTLEFEYVGRDGSSIRTVVRFHGRPAELGPGGARWRLHLEPGVRKELLWEVVTGDAVATPPSRPSIPERRDTIMAAYRSWRRRCSYWHSDVAEFDAMLRQAVDDLRALYIHTDGEQIISAGIPWYTTAFGRDSIITSLQTLPLNPQIAADTLRYLARRQGRKEDPFTEEQPGRIMHELRRGEMARAGEIPHVPYYGTIDATPLWLILLHETWRWTADTDLVAELLPNAERALDWIDRYGDIDGDGFVEYASTSDKGLVNQGWKDSGDGVPFPDGTLPEPPIALVEVQGYVHDAKLRMAEIYEVFGDEARAEELRKAAAALRDRIQEAFWLEELDTFALALDGAKRPIPTVTSNAGHLLWSRVPDAEQARRLTATLMSPAMFSGWGLRTLSEEHVVYNPMSYHNGSVWPHDNALVVLGMSLYGHAHAALPILQGLYDAAAHMDMHRLPELFCGMRRAGGVRPVLYPVSCSPQAWASAAFFMMLQGVLGILPHAPQRILHIRSPRLPEFLRELTIENLRIGNSRISLQFRRHGDRVLANLLALEGDLLNVQIELP